MFGKQAAFIAVVALAAAHVSAQVNVPPFSVTFLQRCPGCGNRPVKYCTKERCTKCSDCMHCGVSGAPVCPIGGPKYNNEITKDGCVGDLVPVGAENTALKPEPCLDRRQPTTCVCGCLSTGPLLRWFDYSKSQLSCQVCDKRRSTFDPAKRTCTTSTSCPAGQEWNKGANRCVPVCNRGQGYMLPRNGNPGMCKDIERCTGSQAYDAARGKCRACPPETPFWYRDGSGFGQCAKTPTYQTFDYKFVGCGRGEVVVESTQLGAQLPIVGTFVWNTGALRSNVDCFDCAQFGAFVTAVGPPSNCSFDATPCSRVTLTTRRALVSEMFSADLLTALNATDADRTFSDVLGCYGSIPGRRLAGLAATGRSLLQSAPGCGQWNQVNSDGRCLFTDCFVGNNPTPSSPDCFGCPANECNNGCGPAGGAISAFIPNSIPFLFDFSEGCCSHDYCYASTAFSKSQCDLNFLNDNLANCATQPTAAFSRLLLVRATGLAALPAFLLTSCPTYALAYYTAVALGGASAYASAQAATKAHEERPQCVAQCPSTQKSGGQGVTTLRINMLRNKGTFPVTYQMYQIPDGLDITYAGATIFSTGGLVSGGGSASVTFAGSTSVVEVTITAPYANTGWDVSVGCPA